MNRRALLLILLMILTACAAGCGRTDPMPDKTYIEQTGEDDMRRTQDEPRAVEPTPMLVIDTGDRRLYAVPEDNASARALTDRLNAAPVTLHLRDYGGFEKVGPLPWDLPKTDTRITTQPGDVILYQGNQITIYYDTNTWTFTRLARIGNADRESLLEALGDGDVTVTMYLEWSE